MSTTRIAFEPVGVLPACLLPFKADLTIDEKSYRKHLADIEAVKGVTAIVTNGHAAEVHALTAEERRQVVGLTVDQLGGRLPTIAGIFTNSGLEAASMARAASSQWAPWSMSSA